MSLSVRASGAERMDAPGVDPAELSRSLDDIRAVNRWLGGTRVVLRDLDRLLRPRPTERVRILDVATGSADIPLAVARWARERGIPVEVRATDVHLGTLEVARQRVAADPDVRVEAADALALPYADGTFHVALCCTALHHFDTPDAVRVLRELRRVASLGVIVSDLRRSRPGWLGARLLAATVWRRNPVTRHDGPLSVRRSFTPAELREVARAAGVRARVHTHPFARLSLVASAR